MENLGVLLFASTFITLCYFTYTWLVPPRNFPRNIPTIPFYVSLIPLFKDVDQEDVYRKYLEGPLRTYGAVKIFFGARWNILVQRPSYVAEVFKYEDVYAKSGNQKKIPYSVLAEYTGDNIISSHGENWRLYQKVIKPGLAQEFDPQPILKNARNLVSMLFDEQAGSVNASVTVPQLFQRYTLANLSEALLDASFETLNRPDAPLHTLQLSVKKEIFKPVFLNFPFLDLLYVPSRQQARKMVARFTDELCNTVLQAHASHSHEALFGTQNLGCRMVAARKTGTLSEQQFRHNMISIFLAGHENPQLLLTSLVFLLAENQDAQDRLRREIRSTGLTSADNAILAELPYLTAVLFETLRMYPPISQLINRRTTQDVILGGTVPIPSGTYMGYNAYSTGRDLNAWGPDPDAFQPERWGTSIDDIRTMYRRVNLNGSFISFHGGRRACLGQKFALFQTRLSVFELITTTRWKLDPTWPRRMTPAGPLYPRFLRVQFEKLQ